METYLHQQVIGIYDRLYSNAFPDLDRGEYEVAIRQMEEVIAKLDNEIILMSDASVIRFARLRSELSIRLRNLKVMAQRTAPVIDRVKASMNYACTDVMEHSKRLDIPLSKVLPVLRDDMSMRNASSDTIIGDGSLDEPIVLIYPDPEKDIVKYSIINEDVNEKEIASETLLQYAQSKGKDHIEYVYYKWFSGHRIEIILDGYEPQKIVSNGMFQFPQIPFVIRVTGKGKLRLQIGCAADDDSYLPEISESQVYAALDIRANSPLKIVSKLYPDCKDRSLYKKMVNRLLYSMRDKGVVIRNDDGTWSRGKSRVIVDRAKIIQVLQSSPSSLDGLMEALKLEAKKDREQCNKLIFEMIEKKEVSLDRGVLYYGKVQAEHPPLTEELEQDEVSLMDPAIAPPMKNYNEILSYNWMGILNETAQKDYKKVKITYFCWNTGYSSFVCHVICGGMSNVSDVYPVKKQALQHAAARTLRLYNPASYRKVGIAVDKMRAYEVFADTVTQLTEGKIVMTAELTEGKKCVLLRDNCSSDEWSINTARKDITSCVKGKRTVLTYPGSITAAMYTIILSSLLKVSIVQVD